MGQITHTQKVGHSPTIVHFVRGISLQQNRKLGLNRLLNQPLRAGS
jgi:hypothetical protein